VIRVKLFEHINDMWLHNWEQLAITGNPRWMIASDRVRQSKRKVSAARFESKYYELHDQHSEHSPESLEIMDKLFTLFNARLDARAKLADGDRVQINFIRMFTAMIDNLMKGSGDVDVIKSRMIVQQAYGQPINPKMIKVPEYMKIVEVVQDQAAIQNELNRR